MGCCDSKNEEEEKISPVRIKRKGIVINFSEMKNLVRIVNILNPFMFLIIDDKNKAEKIIIQNNQLKKNISMDDAYLILTKKILSMGKRNPLETISDSIKMFLQTNVILLDLNEYMKNKKVYIHIGKKIIDYIKELSF